MTAIRRYAQQIAQQFAPERIVLFGSFAYGKPNVDSDVDLLVIMAASNEINQSIRIRRALEAPFPLDLIVRTPKKLHQGIEEGNWFLREIVEKGEVLYEKRDGKMAPQSRSRSARGQTTGKSKATPA